MSQTKTLTNLDKSKLLRELRGRIDFSQEKMAEQLGLDSTYLSQLENARRPIADYLIPKALSIVKRFEKSNDGVIRDEKAAPYGLLDTKILKENFANVAAKLPKTSDRDMKYTLTTLRDLLDELDQREISSAPLSEMQSLAKLSGDSKP